MTLIAHTADLHVRSLSRHVEHRTVVEAFVKDCIQRKVEHIFIGGDTFHTKTAGMSSECIEYMCWMFTELASAADVHVMLGNHDFNLVNKTRQDAISPIVNALNNPKIHLYKNSGVYEFAPGFNWCLFSLFDEENWDSVRPVPGMVNIACFHGSVWGATTETDWLIDEGTTVEFFRKYDIAMLGDIHKQQFLAEKQTVGGPRPWIGYPGSFLQNTYAESIVHGYLLWDVRNGNDFDVEFCELPNPLPFITVDWSGSIDGTLKLAKKYPSGSRFRIRSNEAITHREATELTLLFKRDLRAAEVTYKNDHKINREFLTVGTATLAKEDLRNPEALLKLVKDYHSENNVTDTEWESVSDQIKIYLSQSLGSDDLVRNAKWSLRHLKFDNMFAYGEGNVLNFDNLAGIVGIFGANRAGKSSIVGTIMYSLFNMTDRGNVKNLHVVNVRQPFCYTKAIINVDGTNYVIERQTVKHETKRNQLFASTALNIFRIDDGEAVDLVGEERKDTEKVLRRLIGGGEDCLLTTVAAQDDVKQFINQGSTKRRKDLSRFLDLDIFDRMYELAKFDVNIGKNLLRSLPDRDWTELDKLYVAQLLSYAGQITEKDHLLHDANQRLHDMRAQLSSFKDFVPVTQTQLDAQQLRAQSLLDKLAEARTKHALTCDEIENLSSKIESIEKVQADNDLVALKRRLEALRTLESSFESLKHFYEKDADLLKQQERSLKILDDVPCGTQFPTCKFIKDAFKNKEKVDPQRERVEKSAEKLEKAELALQDLRKEDLANKVSKIEQLIELKSKVTTTISHKKIELVKLETLIADVDNNLKLVQLRLEELKHALKNEENVEVVTLRRELDEVQKQIKLLDSERLGLASKMGGIESDIEKNAADRQHRSDQLHVMKAHELIMQAFSRRGIPNMIVTSQLPVINAEVAKILSGIVDFSVELEVDDDSDSMEVYINYGDSRRPIELGSGMEKTLASIAIRVALINVSSLPKSDMFIIDESFGPLDPSSVEACNRLLMSLKKYFRCVIVITHVDGIKDVVDHVIEITKVEKDSKVLYA